MSLNETDIRVAINDDEYIDENQRFLTGIITFDSNETTLDFNNKECFKILCIAIITIYWSTCMTQYSSNESIRWLKSYPICIRSNMDNKNLIIIVDKKINYWLLILAFEIPNGRNMKFECVRIAIFYLDLIEIIFFYSSLKWLFFNNKLILNWLRTH